MTQMTQIIGTAKIHPFVVFDVNGDEVTTLTEPICNYRVNGGTVTPFTPTISAYNTTMKSFSVTIPDTLADAVGDSVEICIACTEGTAHLLIDIIMSPATLTAIETRLGVLEMTGGGHVGDIIISPDNYDYDASTNKITITGTYSLESFTKITNVTKGILLYLSESPYLFTLTVEYAEGSTIVTTRDVSDKSEDDDVLRIYVNV